MSIFKENLLLVDLSDIDSDKNKSCLVSSPKANCPVNGDNVLGMWECVYINKTHIFVRFTEFYPIQGRIWTNFYNDKLLWSGWKSNTPS